MSHTVAAFQRCPRCGNENSAESFACNFCGFRLKIERIEKFKLFRRYEMEWIAPYPWYMKILYLFVNAPKAFHDINHKRSKSPGLLILLFSSLLYGLMGLAFLSHFNFTGYSTFEPELIIFNLSFFVAFFVFGFIFQLVYFALLIWLFTKGANYAVGFSDRLEKRFGAQKEQKEKYRATDISPFSIYKGGTMLQLEGSYKFQMMLCAFTPFLLINGIKILIVLFGFPTVDVVDLSVSEITNNMAQMFNAPTWAVLDIIDALTIATWVPILMTLAIRELSNSSTTRVLIPTIIIGVIVAILFYFLRPTLFG
ncbi:MAG: zinc ribbon domain-containing protein [Candidatus Lokiarchaeota archaeon]|nr:zinc ribbon domain-containing protein [Candidatus Lokiarchaeota archaeon]